MSLQTCLTCKQSWDGKWQPFCPNCEVARWRSTPNFLSPKHDPSMLPRVESGFRSVVNPDYDAWLPFLATSGTAFYNQKHDTYSIAATLPSGYGAGSAVPPADPMPTYPLDTLMVIGLPKKPHVIAEDESRIYEFLDFGTHTLPPRCEIDDCDNCVRPGNKHCARHAVPPLAE